jgi:hypothetical protein
MVCLSFRAVIVRLANTFILAAVAADREFFSKRKTILRRCIVVDDASTSS